jgi:hypothetical protein
MVDLMENGEYEPTRLAAANFILERVEGKPIHRLAAATAPEILDERCEIDPKLLTHEERDIIRRAMERQIAAKGLPGSAADD